MDAISGLVLAGGKSQRMGTDKALLPLGAETVLHATANRLAAHVDDLLIVRRSDQPSLDLPCDGAARDWRIVYDLHPGDGPLAGLEAGLRACRHPWALVTPVDAPFVRKGLLSLLCAQIATVEPRTRVITVEHGDQTYPLFGVYHRALAERIGEMLEAGERRVIDLLARVPTVKLSREVWGAVDPDGTSFSMMNRREEYEVLCDRWERGEVL